MTAETSSNILQIKGGNLKLGFQLCFMFFPPPFTASKDEVALKYLESVS